MFQPTMYSNSHRNLIAPMVDLGQGCCDRPCDRKATAADTSLYLGDDRLPDRMPAELG